ncbi:MAG: oligopeptide transporter, OPT family [Candidatus Marinimicrobia bacterium]|nr:oligopeptide transporter, OPT family [Candidatus Neomarinimicrobiota bacterium]
MEKPAQVKLPENAYRKLHEGEEFVPVIPDDKIVPEVTGYSLTWGLFYSVLFSMAAAYLGLKIGQVFEAAIPIAILAAGMSVLLKRKNALQENVIIQSIGSSSGVIVAGAIFTIPGLYILGINVSFLQIFLASLLGGFLGILFLIPFRRYFVKEMHGEFPFPEATATTEVLIAGEGGGDQAKVLVSAAIVGGIYDFCVSGFGFWKEVVSTQVFHWGQVLSDKLKLVLKINIGAAVTGLGYIVGLKYSLIIACGSFLAWWVLIPVVYFIGRNAPEAIYPATMAIRDMAPQDIFSNYVRHIGIGGIAAAGIIGILKSSKIIVGAFKLAGKELFGGIQTGEGNTEKRTQKDISMKWISILLLLTFVAVFIFFLFGVVELNVWHAVVGLLIVAVIAFLFTTVAARAIAIVGTNPVSGMTLMTLILSSVILVKVGLSGNQGMLAALIIGGVVCTALSMAGAFVSDLKIGYWLGTTPQKQESYKFLGTLFAAASVGVVILVLYKTYGFGPGGLEAPQASAMAAVLKPLMTGAPAPWLLYLAGVFLAIILEFIGVPPLAFALGMYLPIYLNTPLLAGGLIAHFVGKSTEKEELSKKRKDRGTLIASGFIAGGAIMGVVSAFIVFFGKQILNPDWTLMKAIGTEYWSESTGGEILGFAMFVMLLIYLYWDSTRIKE